MPADATQGDLDDVLDSAKWWSMFFGSAFSATVDAPTPESKGTPL
jgi:hypothetical protein